MVHSQIFKRNFFYVVREEFERLSTLRTYPRFSTWASFVAGTRAAGLPFLALAKCARHAARMRSGAPYGPRNGQTLPLPPPPSKSKTALWQSCWKKSYHVFTLVQDAKWGEGGEEMQKANLERDI